MSKQFLYDSINSIEECEDLALFISWKKITKRAPAFLIDEYPNKPWSYSKAMKKHINKKTKIILLNKKISKIMD